MANTSIMTRPRRQNTAPGKMVRKAVAKRQRVGKEKGCGDRRKASSHRHLVRRLSKAGEQKGVRGPHGTHCAGGHHHTAICPLSRSASSGEGSPSVSRTLVSLPIPIPRSPESRTSSNNSSSTASNSPSSSFLSSSAVLNPAPGRPSSLRVAKQKKLSLKSSHRRKSVHNFPVSPLVCALLPGKMMVGSPARSPSPLAGAVGGSHPIAGSHFVQQTVPAHHHRLGSAPTHHQNSPTADHPSSMSIGQN